MTPDRAHKHAEATLNEIQALISVNGSMSEAHWIEHVAHAIRAAADEARAEERAWARKDERTAVGIEREACAREVEDLRHWRDDPNIDRAVAAIAAAIRSRGGERREGGKGEGRP